MLPVAAAICSIPALFVLSLILHWHLAATIIFGIVTSLAIIAPIIYISITSESELEDNKNNVKRCNSVAEKDIKKIKCFDNYFPKNQDEHNDNSSSKSLPTLKLNTIKIK